VTLIRSGNCGLIGSNAIATVSRLSGEEPSGGYDFYETKTICEGE